MNPTCALLLNLDRLHTTDLGAARIKKNLSLGTEQVVDWCRSRIESPDAVIRRAGKNWYADVGDCILTVNAHSYTIITAHKKNDIEIIRSEADKTLDIHKFWKAALKQDACAMKAFFDADAYVNWHNTNEHFTVDEFIRANCEYPGHWDGEIERIEKTGNLIITVTRVFAADKVLSFHAVSFIGTREDKIISIDEYWGDDGPAPQWRLDKCIGNPIWKESKEDKANGNSKAI